MQAKHLRRYTVRGEQVGYASTAVGDVINNALAVVAVENSDSQDRTQVFNVSTCATVHGKDTDFRSMQRIRKAGVKWKMKTGYLALTEAVLGSVVGSGIRHADSGKLRTLRSQDYRFQRKNDSFGIFSYFLENIPTLRL